MTIVDEAGPEKLLSIIDHFCRNVQYLPKMCVEYSKIKITSAKIKIGLQFHVLTSDYPMTISDGLKKFILNIAKRQVKISQLPITPNKNLNWHQPLDILLLVTTVNLSRLTLTNVFLNFIINLFDYFNSIV